MTTMIKFGNDNRQKPQTGALQKWEDIVGLKSGTQVQIIKECHDTGIVVIELPTGGISPCGRKNYKPGTKRMVAMAAIETNNNDNIVDIDAIINISPANQSFNKTAITG